LEWLEKNDRNKPPQIGGENHGDLPILEANGFLHVGTSLFFQQIFVGANI